MYSNVSNHSTLAWKATVREPAKRCAQSGSGYLMPGMQPGEVFGMGAAARFQPAHRHVGVTNFFPAESVWFMDRTQHHTAPIALQLYSKSNSLGERFYHLSQV